MSSEPEQPSQRRMAQELSRAERDLLRRIDPGSRGVLIAGLVLVLVVSCLLPWTQGFPGWQVLAGMSPAGFLLRLFSINATIAGVGISALALLTRRWALAWVAAMACGIVSFEGVIAIWSQQTAAHGGGPGLGLILAVLAMITLAASWLKLAWSRP